jgi:hypothetical protein
MGTPLRSFSSNFTSVIKECIPSIYHKGIQNLNRKPDWMTLAAMSGRKWEDSMKLTLKICVIMFIRLIGPWTGLGTIVGSCIYGN